MLHFGSVPCPVLTLTICVYFFVVILKANGQISAWQSVNFHGSTFSAFATPAVMHLISTPATLPVQLAYHLFTAPHALPSQFVLSYHLESLSLWSSPAMFWLGVSGVFIWPGFWPAFFLWRLCSPASRLPGWEKETIQLFLLCSQSVQGSGSTPYLLQIKSLPNARRLCQGKPSPPSFKVNMRSRQGLQFCSLDFLLRVFSAFLRVACSSFLIQCHLNEVSLWLCNTKSYWNGSFSQMDAQDIEDFIFETWKQTNWSLAVLQRKNKINRFRGLFHITDILKF